MCTSTRYGIRSTAALRFRLFIRFEASAISSRQRKNEIRLIVVISPENERDWIRVPDADRRFPYTVRLVRVGRGLSLQSEWRRRPCRCGNRLEPRYPGRADYRTPSFPQHVGLVLWRF